MIVWCHGIWRATINSQYSGAENLVLRRRPILGPGLLPVPASPRLPTAGGSSASGRWGASIIRPSGLAFPFDQAEALLRSSRKRLSRRRRCRDCGGPHAPRQPSGFAGPVHQLHYLPRGYDAWVCESALTLGGGIVGRRTMNREPRPGAESISMVPPWSWTIP